MASVKILNKQVLDDFLNDIKNDFDAKNFARINDKIALKLETESKNCFLTKTDPFGTKWKPLKYRAGQTLRDSGRLFNSIASESDSSKIRIFVQGGLEYAQAHNDGFEGEQQVSSHSRVIKNAFGKKIKPKKINIRSFMRKQNIPQRQFIPNKLPENWINIIINEFANNIFK